MIALKFEVLECAGGLLLRYSDAEVDDNPERHLLLEDDPRLAQIRPGDFIEVRGKIVSSSTPSHAHSVQRAAARGPLAYRIDEVWLVRRRE